MNIFSRLNDFSIHEFCRIVNTCKLRTDITNVYLYYSISDNNVLNKTDYKSSFISDEYNLSLDKYKNLDISINHNKSIKNKYNYLDTILVVNNFFSKNL